MKIIKLWYHIIAAIQRVFYKLLYGSRLQIGKNVTWRRGFSIMMNREARIVKMELKVRLLLIGDGNLREQMLARINEYGIANQVIYLGRREDIHQFYNAMDCFLLSSLYEGRVERGKKQDKTVKSLIKRGA